MLTYKIHILRHGLTQANLEGRYIGRSDPPLCEQGRAQLRELAAGCEYPSVQRVYTSPLLRARQTAEMIYPGQEQETVDKLQALKVYTQYRDLISTAPLEIIYSGSADLERVKQALAAAFATLPREEVRVISTAAPHVCRESVQHVEDVLDVTQGKLGMGFSCGSDDMPALLMGNTLFGGSSNSKLFLNVREKLSLCYYASSLYHRQKGLITVSSGIEFQNYQRAYDEIMAQLEAVQKGELEDWELEGARSTLLNSYETVGESQGKLENFYLGQAATGQHETPADLARAIQDMTAERICRAMSTVKLDTVYFLKGKEAEA